jgi:GLPGLI family protein
MKFFHLLFFILAANSTFAKTPKNQDTAFYKCTYQIKWVADTLKMTEGRPDTYILEIGQNFSKGYWYYDFYLDSIYRNPAGVSISLIRNTIRNNSSESLIGGPFNEYLYKSYNEGKIIAKNRLGMKLFVYEDKLEAQGWKLLQDTMTIYGYFCQKATCDFRGRSYEAWFTPDILMNEGPWKFFGLPGLIMKVQDTQNHYCFEISGIQKISQLIEIDIDSKTQKIDRKKFLQLENKGLNDQIVSMEGERLGIVDNSPKPIRQWDYLERDYKSK